MCEEPPCENFVRLTSLQGLSVATVFFPECRTRGPGEDPDERSLDRDFTLSLGTWQAAGIRVRIAAQLGASYLSGGAFGGAILSWISIAGNGARRSQVIRSYRGPGDYRGGCLIEAFGPGEWREIGMPFGDNQDVDRWRLTLQANEGWAITSQGDPLWSPARVETVEVGICFT